MRLGAIAPIARMATLVRLMRGPGHQSPAAALRRWSCRGLGLALALVLAGCSGGGQPGGGLADPPQSVSPAPDYPNACAPVGADTSSPCLRITLDAIDAARAAEGLGPWRCPSDFPRLTVPEQLFVAIDRERVDRGLAPFTGLATALDAAAEQGADDGASAPRPGRAYAAANTEWIGDVDNGLDADFQWMYDDGPDSGVPGCSDSQTRAAGPTGRSSSTGSVSHLVMGAAFDPTGDTSQGDQGGSSLAAILAAVTAPGRRRDTIPLRLHLEQALAATSAGTLRPLRAFPHRSPRRASPTPATT